MPPTCKRSTTQVPLRRISPEGARSTSHEMFGSFLNFLPYTEVDMERVLLSHASEIPHCQRGCSRSFCEVEQHSSSSTERTPLSYFCNRSSFFNAVLLLLVPPERDSHTHAIDETCSAAAGLKPPGHTHSRLRRLDDSIKTGP